MRVEEIVGANMRQARERAGMSQAELGEALAEHLGDQWRRRQPVSTAETGRRAFTAAELLTIASVLGVGVNALFAPPADLQFIEVGDEDRKPLNAVSGALSREANDYKLKALVWRAVVDVRKARSAESEAIKSLIEGLQQGDSALLALNDALDDVFTRLDLVDDGADGDR